MSKENHEQRDGSGRYKTGFVCDFCGKPAGTEPMTDAEVCGGTDGPGFLLCERVRCCTKREALSVEARRVAYTVGRAAARASQEATAAEVRAQRAKEAATYAGKRRAMSRSGR